MRMYIYSYHLSSLNQNLIKMFLFLKKELFLQHICFYILEFYYTSLKQSQFICPWQEHPPQGSIKSGHILSHFLQKYSPQLAERHRNSCFSPSEHSSGHTSCGVFAIIFI